MVIPVYLIQKIIFLAPGNLIIIVIPALNTFFITAELSFYYDLYIYISCICIPTNWPRRFHKFKLCKML